VILGILYALNFGAEDELTKGSNTVVANENRWQARRDFTNLLSLTQLNPRVMSPKADWTTGRGPQCDIEFGAPM